jgi:hypothetical protein
MSQTIAGGVSNVLADVETTTRALRAVLRAHDTGSLGSYSLGTKSGIMAAGLGAAAPIFSLRYAPTINPASLMLVKKVLITPSTLGTAFTAGSALFEAFVIRGYTVADTGGGSLTLGTAVTSGKLRTSQAITGVTDFRISATATLTAGTQTVDTNPIASVITQIPATTTNYAILPANYPLFEAKPGEHPLVLALNEGLVIRATVPATGTWSFSVDVLYDEVAAY